MTERLRVLNEGARRAVASALHTGGPPRLVDATRQIQAAVDREVDEAQVGAEPRACKLGCDACCHRLVTATLPEVHLVAETVLQRFSDDEREVWMGRVSALAEENSGFWTLREMRTSAACPFLVDHACSIYEVRPVSCRALNSTEASTCRAHYLEGSGEPAGVLREQEAVSSVNLTVVNATRDVGVLSGLYELAPAVMELLGEPAQANLEKHKLLSEWTHEKPVESPILARAHADPAAREVVAKRQEGDAAGAAKALLRVTDPAFRAIFGHGMPNEYASEDQLEDCWEQWGRALSDFEGSSLPAEQAFELLQDFDSFLLAYAGRDVREFNERFMRTAHRYAAAAYPELTAPFENRRRPGKPRLGFISYRIKNFNGSRWALGWLLNMPPEIETYVINLAEQEDHTSRCFRRNANRYLHLPFRVVDAARMIRDLDLDALIFTDIGMDGFTTQLACLRLARKQYAAWGHPVTSGSPAIDYYLSSELMEPENAQEHYSEQLVRLPGIGVTYQRRLFTPSTKSREELGLPEGGFLLFCQHPSKQVPSDDHIFQEIALTAAKPIVFVNASPKGGSILRSRIEKLGIDARFLPFQSMPDYLRILQLADASIDSFSWSGGVTTIDSLAMSTPTIHLPGKFMRSRMSRAFLIQAGAQGLTAKSEADFVNLCSSRERQHEAMATMNVDELFEDASSADAIAEHVIGGLSRD